MENIGFIGVGNMGGAMANAIAQKESETVYVYDEYRGAYDKFMDREWVSIAPSMEELIKQAKYIVLSVKPQYYEEVCRMISGDLTEKHIIITVSPGHTVEQVKQLLGESTRVIRTMPNTPALIGKGITAYTYDKNQISEEEIERMLEWFKSFGQAIYVEEKLMAAVVATTGSSPAYGYMFIEAMADAAVSFGMPRDMAYQMSAGAIKGACDMILETKKHPGELKDAVTSPGGTTIQAVTALEAYGFRNSIIKAMTACYDQAAAMSKN